MLNCSLPAGYEVFLQTLGTGCWADASVIAPEELHAFDESVGEMCGLIAIAENVDGQGSYVAFNPLDNKLYFCCHDPFGYALIANSFGEFIELITALWMNDPEKGARNYYLSLPSFKEVELPQDEPNRA
jgi:hypothetical protein